MRNGRSPRNRALAVALATTALAVAGCNGDDTAGSDGRDPGAHPDGRLAAGQQGDACELLTADDLEALFPGGVPDPTGTSMGEGFAECEWGRDSDDATVLLSTLPAADYRGDYVDQLDVTAPVAGVGDAAVSFPGFVGIGRGSARGGTVGFAEGERAVLVAVRSGGEPTEDAGLAAELAVVVAGRL